MSTTCEPHTLEQPPFNATFMGVVVGAAKHFDSTVSVAEFYCESGFAFALNIHSEIMCPSGPYCWNHAPVLERLKLLGLHGTYVGSDSDGDERERRISIEQLARKASDEAVASMEGLEHQLITSNDETSFNLAMPWGDDAPSCLPELSYESWRNQSANAFGFYRFDPCDDSVKRQRMLAGLECALEMYESPSAFQQDGYQFGLSAYDAWQNALDSDSYDKHGHWWNAMVWSECRNVASKYFQDWPGPSEECAQLLSNSFSKVGELMQTASPHELDRSKKKELIREAAECESTLPHLIRELAEPLRS